VHSAGQCRAAGAYNVPGMSIQVPEPISRAVAAGGWPIVVLLIVLYQIVPKIDHGIAIADHVDSTLQRIDANCSLAQRPP